MKVLSFFVLILLMIFTGQISAKNTISIPERKEIENVEYLRCMSVFKNNNAHEAIRYIREKQKGNTLVSTSTTLAEENCAADSIGLFRYQTLREIRDDYHGDVLVEINSPVVDIADNLPNERRVAHVWVRDYLIELALYLKKETGAIDYDKPEITATSLVRSRVDQDRISGVRKYVRRVRGKLRHYITSGKSFADCSSEAVCSTHLTGSAVDIRLPKKSKKERKLLEERLMADREAGRILVILENKGNHFHVFVFPPQYSGIPMIREQVAAENILSSNPAQ